MNRRTFLKTNIALGLLGVLPGYMTAVQAKPVIDTIDDYKVVCDQFNIEGLIKSVYEHYVSIDNLFISDTINDPTFRNLVLTYGRHFYSGLQAKGLIRDFQIVCDERNNSPEVVDSGNYNYDSYIKITNKLVIMEFYVKPK